MTTLTQSQTDAINSAKAAEVDMAKLINQLSTLPDVDKRAIALAKTNMQQAFMWLTRAAANPEDPYL